MSVTEAVVSSQQGPTASRPTYRLIQILRAVAALLVVAHHATIMLWERDRIPVQTWIAGSSGVDLFFVISGFVMTISSAPLRKSQHPARTFLVRRLERVVPLYWLITAIKVAVLLRLPGIAVNGLGGTRHIISSFLFIPHLGPAHRFEPVVVVGWTLNLEMAFYLLFAAALALRWRPLVALAPVLILWPLGWYWLPLLPVTWSMHLPSAAWFYMNFGLWEFLFGILLGVGVNRVRRVPWPMGLVLLAGGFIALLTLHVPPFIYARGLYWGVPALCIVTGAISLESRWGKRSPRWALELGDASYSIYLIHTFTLPAIGLWLLRWPHHWNGELAAAMTTAVVLSALSGELLYRAAERPLLQWFKGRRRTAIPANA